VELDGRTVSGGYRFGFSSKEKINEISGPGKSYDFGDRIFDPRLCRWMKIDSEVNKLPYFSSYGFVNSNPLRFIYP
jgi:RHS repeat-associated protein